MLSNSANLYQAQKFGSKEWSLAHFWLLKKLSGYASIDINHAVLSFVYTGIGYACSDFILAFTAVEYSNTDIIKSQISWRLTNEYNTRATHSYNIVIIIHDIYIFVQVIRQVFLSYLLEERREWVGLFLI